MHKKSNSRYFKDGITTAIIIGAFSMSPYAVAENVQKKGSVPSKEQIMKELPDIQDIRSVKATPVPNVIEVATSQNILYLTKDFKYVFVSGHLLDTKTKKSLTDETIAVIQKELLAEQKSSYDKIKPEVEKSLNQLKDTHFIKEVKGSGKPTFFMVSDIRCGFCKKTEAETISKLDHYTLYRIPVAFLGPESLTLAKKAWCAKDKLQAWKDLEHSKKTDIPEIKDCDASIIDKNNEWSKQYKVTGTPTFFLENGDRWNQGFLPVDKLKVFLEKGPSEVQ